ncbi:MAG: manganese efflux pump MntP family protein [Desulforegulaceae bacterium]|nr:manganese efflux pump MntP family protein [Desulforegulaceae bacterium]
MIFESISLSFALAMDAFAVSVSSGIKIDKVGKREIFRISWHFGLFQFLFFVSGYLAGTSIYKFINSIANPLASIILLIIGLHMIYEGIKNDEECFKNNPSKGKTLIFLSVATSIDALAAGFGMSILESDIFFVSFCVFAITLILCAFGAILGDRLSKASLLKGFSEIIGGVILLVLSFKFFFGL